MSPFISSAMEKENVTEKNAFVQVNKSTLVCMRIMVQFCGRNVASTVQDGGTVW